MFRRDRQPCHLGALRAMAGRFSTGEAGEHGSWRFWCDAGGAGLGARILPVTREDTFHSQPVCDGDLVLIADARIDNRHELRGKLGLPTGQGGEEVADSFFILRAYERWGLEAPRYLIGDFVFVLWDRRSGVLLAARDHSGRRALYFHVSDRCVAISSAPRGLFGLPHVGRRLDESALADYLVLIGDPGRTLYEDVSRLPPAHKLVVDATGIRVERYWSPNDVPELPPRSDEEHLECFRALYEEAVACRLRSATPVGAFLSGGLDSSSVVCVAARHLLLSGGRLFTFTAVAPPAFVAPEMQGWYPDETPYIEEIAAQYPNVVPSYVDGGAGSSQDGLDALFEVTEAPVRNPANRVWVEAIIQAATARGIGVLLQGQQGNTWISYHGLTRLAELASTGSWLTLAHELRALSEERSLPVLRLLKHFVLSPLAPATLRAVYRHLRTSGDPWTRYSPIHPDFAAETRVGERYHVSPENKMKDLWRDGRALKAGLANQGAMHAAADISSARRNASGVDLRDPTADKRVVEFCLAAPSTLFLRKGTDRLLIRKAMEGVVPSSILRNTKRGSQATDWFERLTAQRERIAAEMELLERCDLARRALDLGRMRSLVQSWPHRNRANSQETMVSYRLLLERGLMVGRFIRWFESTS